MSTASALVFVLPVHHALGVFHPGYISIMRYPQQEYSYSTEPIGFDQVTVLTDEFAVYVLKECA